jgi:hypothetical protein
MTGTIRTFAMAVLLPVAAAYADVGKVVVLEGTANRQAAQGKAEKLAVGSSIELGDTVAVDKASRLKLELTDGSVIMLGEGGKLLINEAAFEGQERKGFSALLKAGSLWTKVKKALGGAKYEVSTERAVAGVRGTIFRIDADALVKAAKGKGKKASLVRVVEGVVNVTPSTAVAAASKKTSPAKGPRVQVAGPSEVSADEWEKRFVDLQANQQVMVGVDLWEQAEVDKQSQSDAFSKWVEKNQ